MDNPDIILAGRVAYTEYGDLAPLQNPYIVGAGREREALMWWRGMDAERTFQRSMSAKDRKA